MVLGVGWDGLILNLSQRRIKMPKKYLLDRLNYLVDQIRYEEDQYKHAKELGSHSCYGAGYSLGALDRLREELFSHQHFLLRNDIVPPEIKRKVAGAKK